MGRELWKGNEAIAEAAIRAGLQAYFGYPITPQTEVLEWMSRRMPELGRVFVQAESEVAAINMIYGAACTGARVMSTSSSPGISLMMEGISYIAGTEVPIVLINVMRGGPGLGNIAPSQGDYHQAVRGGGHGDYPRIVLAPASVQEAVDLTFMSFDLAEKYRTIVMIIADGSIGQMMEPAEMPPMQPVYHRQWDWAVTGKQGRERRVLSSIYLDPYQEEQTNLRLMQRWKEIQANEVRYREYYLDDAEFVVIGFGTAGRVALSAVRAARQEGLKVGLLRPISVSPFPHALVDELTQHVRGFLVVEMNTGQMLEDVQLANKGRVPIRFYGRPGGVVPFPDEILDEIHHLVQHPPALDEDPRLAWLERMTRTNGGAK
ncbi:MAG: 3-methyl-2-oxobutanoate dehydrogenase subunit VorB [Anaerolineales bacterium]